VGVGIKSMNSIRRISTGLMLCACLLLAISPPTAGQDKWSQALEQAKIYQELKREGKYRQALHPAGKVVELVGQVKGVKHPQYANALSNLAGLYEVLGNHPQALALYRQAVEIKERALGPEHISLATTLNNLAGLYVAMGRLAQAEPIFKRSLQITGKALGPDHPSLAISLNNLGLLYMKMGHMQKAGPLYKRSLAIYEKKFGPNHLSLAATLNNLAGFHADNARYAEAESLYLRALEIKKLNLGGNHPDIAQGLNNLGQLYVQMGAYAKAEPYFNKALNLVEKLLGRRHYLLASFLNNLAGLYKNMGEFEKAEPLYKRALSIRKKTLPADHPDLASALSNLALLYDEMGLYAQAKPIYQKALKIFEKALGPDHPKVATVLNNLAMLYKATGVYDKAESLSLRSLALTQKALGKDNSQLAVGLNNLASIYLATGANPKALALLERALALQEKTLGPSHPDLAQTLHNLAAYYFGVAGLQKSLMFYERALAIENEHLGPEHPKVAATLQGLTMLHLTMGNHQQALPLAQRAAAIAEKALGPRHPELALILCNLAMAHYQNGQYGKALSIYERALEIIKAIRTHEHPDASWIISNQGLLLAAMGRYRGAHEHFMKAQKMDSALINIAAGGLPEERLLSYLALLRKPMEIALNLVVQKLSADQQAIKDVFEVWLARKGASFEAQKRFQEALLHSGSKEALNLHRQLNQTRVKLSGLIFNPPPAGQPGGQRERFELLSRKKHGLEARLAAISKTFARDHAKKHASLDQVAQAMPPGSVLLDFAMTTGFNFETRIPARQWRPARYLVFVLPAGKPGKLRLVDLGPAETIDLAVSGYKKAMRDAAGGLPELDEERAARTGARLYDLLIKPLEKYLAAADTVLVSPDGNLNLIPFEVFKDHQGRYLIQRFLFNYLGASRDLAAAASPLEQPGSGPLLMGNPDFGLDPQRRQEVLAALKMEGSKTGFRATPRAGELSGPWAALPETGQEVAGIAGVLGGDARVYTGARALEEVLAGHKGPKILHLATHGFFLPPEPGPKNASTAGILQAGLLVNPPARLKYFGLSAQLNNPLIRSGLILAGANQALASSRNSSAGILTSEKILGLNLMGTGLVVLSACETGLGQTLTGEGVFGLRRAFSQVGAQSLVMSMWMVPDLETRELMLSFYGYLNKGLDRARALRRAVLKQMYIARTRYKTSHPLFWGAFVFMGQPK
jgi:tetratricopeptide (TPR) repeat protein